MHATDLLAGDREGDLRCAESAAASFRRGDFCRSVLFLRRAWLLGRLRELRRPLLLGGAEELELHQLRAGLGRVALVRLKSKNNLGKIRITSTNTYLISHFRF